MLIAPPVQQGAVSRGAWRAYHAVGARCKVVFVLRSDTGGLADRQQSLVNFHVPLSSAHVLAALPSAPALRASQKAVLHQVTTVQTHLVQ